MTRWRAKYLRSDVADLKDADVVPLFEADAVVRPDGQVLPVPCDPGRRVPAHVALEPDRLARLRDLVVRDGVELWWNFAAGCVPMAGSAGRGACTAG